MSHYKLNQRKESKMTWTKTLIIGAVIGSLLAVVAYTALSRVDAQLRQEMNTSVSREKVVTSNQLQPFGESQEDEYTAAQALQDTSSPQVTQHGYFLQATSNPQVTGSL